VNDHERHMRHALTLGRRGLGKVWPWPSVGCVIVKDGRIIGRGTSDKIRVMHAETLALEQAGDAARGATVYVTLEPCAHHGTTPPCAEALVRAGVARVVSACDDPNPLVSGKGYQILRDAGIEVITGVLAKEATQDHKGFLLSQTEKRPMVTLKLASTLDGRIATATGDSKWITGPEARRMVHAMRACHDAVMVGGGTARADDPQLNVRGMGAVKQPVRVVLSRRLDLPMNGYLAKTAKDQPLWMCHGGEADSSPWQALGAKTIACETTAGQVDASSALRALAQEGITRVFCEGGGTLAASLLTAGLVDDLIVFHAGCVIGAEGIPSLATLGLSKLTEAPRFQLVKSRPIGGDVLQHWRPVEADLPMSSNT